ncbi:SDR family oxidoreductase [Peredibacter sp. HCB2-198]|uniref:SDR family oxidoreductase n=1 Tax=Peredibacter sp. HCB2-198 TaxID=3383025 RepID=UPI0038B62249
MQTQSQVSGKVALITGGASGLGAEICRTLANHEIKTIVADIHFEKANKIAKEIEQNGGKATAIELNVTNYEKIPEKLDGIVQKFGSLDVLINNAGIDLTTPISEMPVTKWNDILNTNLTGPFVLSKEALRIMHKKKGNIINIVSTAAKRSWANASAYHASKWGLLGFTHALHVEGREMGVKVTAVICGGMRTPFLLDRFPDIDVSTLQPPSNVANVISQILYLPHESVIPEVMVLPMKETSWP